MAAPPPPRARPDPRGPGALALEQKQFARAARLPGAVEARLAELNATFFARDDAEYHQYMAALRAQLPEAAFAAAYTAGRAMTMDEAVEYALGDQPD